MTQDLRFEQYCLYPRQRQSSLDTSIERHLAGLDRRAKVSGLSEYIHGLGLDGRDTSMMALAHTQCPDTIEEYRQHMQRALAQGQMQSMEVFDRLQHTIQEKQQAKLNVLGVDDISIESIKGGTGETSIDTLPEWP